MFSAGSVATNLFRRRSKRLAWLFGLTIIPTAVTAAWVRFDQRNMPAIEHYSQSGRYLVIIPGAYVAGILLILEWTVRRTVHSLKRSGNRPTARPI